MIPQPLTSSLLSNERTRLTTLSLDSLWSQKWAAYGYSHRLMDEEHDA